MHKHPTLLQQLARWWEKRFNLPSNHELFQSKTLGELLVDFYLDEFEKHPLEAHRNEDGHIQFMDTGDDLIDKWEQEIADGKIPDLNEAFSEDSVEYLKKLRQKAEDRNPYAGMSMKDMYDKVERQAQSEGLTRNSITETQRKEVEARLRRKTFAPQDD